MSRDAHKEGMMRMLLNVGGCGFVWVMMLGGAMLCAGCGGSDEVAAAASWRGDVIPVEEVSESPGGGKGDGGASPLASEGGGASAAEGQEEATHEEEGAVEEVSVRDERAHRCRVTCFKVMWCQESSEAMVSCVEMCELEEESGAVKEPVVRCLEGAETCREVDRCHRRLEICDEVCGAKHHCGQWDDTRGDCHLWCAEEVWSGRLTWENHGCVTEQARGMRCDALDVERCGLREVEEGKVYGG
ncbi:hypothetical protein FRC98_00825 [Lujinxingia vulgaris]|uniref:Uncharacterized protein n=1 Tax=Lujinxingia vulgaris TaxID=2600176 RepID=A0A5C6XAJ8_9DELT|nr:hypothetical protein [Lujinxingia vulgaris]TXD38977.1 hypothetical protein FRC98_00825 [Lujinxingia vulgaris]